MGVSDKRRAAGRKTNYKRIAAAAAMALTILTAAAPLTARAEPGIESQTPSSSSTENGTVSGLEGIQGLQSGESPGGPAEGATPQPPQDGGEQKTLPLWMFLAGGVLLAALITAGAIAVLQKKKRMRTEDGEKKPEEAGTEAILAEPPKERREKSPGGLLIGNTHHIGNRANQQDSFCISNVENETLVKANGVLAVVADGMGGLSDGAQISAIVTSAMLRRFEQGAGLNDPVKGLSDMLGGANDEVNRYLAQAGRGQSGSTMVAVIIREKLLYFISVGDSRICLVRGGEVYHINREHNYAAELDEKAARGEISFSEAHADPQRKALTSYIGMGEIALIDRNIKPFPLLPGDRVVLMSDGVFGALSDEEIAAALQSDAVKAAQELERLVLQKQKQHQDNFTAVILQCE